MNFNFCHVGAGSIRESKYLPQAVPGLLSVTGWVSSDSLAPYNSTVPRCQFLRINDMVNTAAVAK